jgi:hypothetical protein
MKYEKEPGRFLLIARPASPTGLLIFPGMGFPEGFS